MNLALMEKFPERTAEAIKAHRRQQAYRELVATYTQEQLEVVDGPAPQPVVEASNTQWRDRLIQHLQQLPRMPTTTEHLVRLERLSATVGSRTLTDVYEELSLVVRGMQGTQPWRAQRGKRSSQEQQMSNRWKRRDVITSLWEPMTAAEIKRAISSVSTAPGPDGMTVEQVKKLPLGALEQLFNLIMVCRKCPPVVAGGSNNTDSQKKIMQLRR
ncbi:Hypothetical predicted protein [Podarcis lilfordi]|uniref:Uncharacterized protein n=1 Tax=Podarcis lilfordi TaxID=74358 RepID=A0AA35LEY2_9SAUR|nr:Hypothetical predicted protein [Podarcis lilfordi]